MIEWMATAFSILGNVFNIKKSVWGFILWIIGNAMWVYIGCTKHMWGMTALFSVYIVMSAWGIWEWTRSDKTKQKNKGDR